MNTNGQGLKSVLITGASTGIGAACVQLLASHGWRVFAGVRREADGQALTATNGGEVVPVLLDVTCPEQIRETRLRISRDMGETGLHGLVNNAGIAVGGPLEFLSAEQIETQFRVNVFGPIAVTQAFLPLLRKVKGRIVFTSSNSGFWCEPFLNVYGGSKHALEAIGDSLRVELRPWGMHVALIEPGMIKTPIWDKARQAFTEVNNALPREAVELYAQPLDALRRMVHETPAIAAEPIRVALAVRHALESSFPRTRYRVGLDSRAQYYLRKLLPDRVRDWIGRKVMGI